jgi:hypothetical protein
MEDRKLIEECLGFDWDKGNIVKNWESHHVSGAEVESIFFNHPLVQSGRVEEEQKEKRYYALGETNSGRKLFVVFTIRKKLIRPISARDMSKKERKAYESK